MSKPIVFLGPSISVEKAKTILDANYKPPAKKGDLFPLLFNDVTIVGIIDGYFLQDYPPTPIEVYNLLRKKNIKVFGSSSLGALRAVELSRFGMIGIGKIYDMFQRNVLKSDDEVAVTFTGYSKFKSDALIDIRYNLFLAQKHGYIDEDTKKIIFKVSKNTYFPYRVYNDILDRCKTKYPSYNDKIRKFESYLKYNIKSLKELDAIALLNHIKKNYKY